MCMGRRFRSFTASAGITAFPILAHSRIESYQEFCLSLFPLPLTYLLWISSNLFLSPVHLCQVLSKLVHS